MRAAAAVLPAALLVAGSAFPASARAGGGEIFSGPEGGFSPEGFLLYALTKAPEGLDIAFRNHPILSSLILLGLPAFIFYLYRRELRLGGRPRAAAPERKNDAA